MRTLTIAALVTALTGCANPINQHNAAKYHDWGMEAERAGDYQLAERNYQRALANARIGHSPDAGISMAMYNLGRVKGHLCKHDEAEKLLTEALQLEEKVTGPESGTTTMRLFELARLHFDRKRYAASAPYFARAVPAVKKLGVQSTDPIALADVLDQYGTALARLGQSAESNGVKAEADALRLANPGKVARFKPSPYPESCQR
jgi:tetratricopeptide (TPR) repeat protein